MDHPKEFTALMARSWLTRYNVDTVPAILRPALYLYGYGVGALFFVYYLVQRPTIAVHVEGHEQLDVGSNYIFCHWHGSVPLSFQSNIPRMVSLIRQRPHVWMQDAGWHMKPIHVLLRLMGVEKLVLGSTGRGGRQAADRLVSYLRSGYSTVLLPDGPSGPAKSLKKGVLHIALQSQVPILPLRVTASRCIRTSSWDRKQHPVPFSTIRVQVGRPIRVTQDTFHEAEVDLREALG